MLQLFQLPKVDININERLPRVKSVRNYSVRVAHVDDKSLLDTGKFSRRTARSSAWRSAAQWLRR